MVKGLETEYVLYMDAHSDMTKGTNAINPILSYQPTSLDVYHALLTD